MALSIVALFIFIFGAYAYGYVLLLWARHRSFASSGAFTDQDARTTQAGVRLFTMCAVWFVLLTIIEFRALLGDPRQDDLLDLTSLAMVFVFPGTIFHSYLYASLVGVTIPHDRYRRWRAVLWSL